MSGPVSATWAAGPEELGRACVEHLAREEEVLRSALEGLCAVHNALVAGGPAAQAEALQRQEKLTQAREALNVQRVELRHQAAAKLGIPPEAVTLGELAQRLGGPLDQELRRARQRLRRLAAETETQARRTTLFCYLALASVQRLLVEVTGGPRDGGRYGPDGARPKSSLGPILQLEG
jgi:hypothetical protein